MKIEITMTEICLLADLFCERFKISAKDAQGTMAAKAVPANDCAPNTPHSTLSTLHPKEDITRVKTAADEFMDAFQDEMRKLNDELAAAGLPTIKVGEDCGVESDESDDEQNSATAESDAVFKDVPAEDDDDDDEITAKSTSATIEEDEFVDDCAFALKAAGSTLENATPQKICDALVAHGGYADANKTDVRETLIDCCNNHRGNAFKVDFHRIGRGAVFTFTKNNDK